MIQRKAAIAAMLSATALVAAACGFRDDGGGGEGAVKTGTGVTDEPCAKTPNKDNGCVYLGIITDQTGPFSPLAIPITEGQQAFWKRVNEAGGIKAGDKSYDVDVTTYVKNNNYNPQTHQEVFKEIEGKVLGLAQTLGSPMTNAILDQLEDKHIVSAPASWSSEWAFTDVVLQAGANYCVESMNAIDYAADELGAKSSMAVHYPGDYGGDAAGGAKVASEARKLTFTDVETAPGEENQAGAIRSIIGKKPDVVILSTGPKEAATIVGKAAQGGFKGKFIGTSPTWNPGLLATAAAPALEGLYLQSAPWGTFSTDTPGHKAMREAVGKKDGNDGYTAGWVWSYAMKAALEKAAADGDLTREGLHNAAKSLTEVDYEGMLPNEAGNFAAEPDKALFRQSIINKPDKAAAAGVSEVKGFFTGPTAEKFKFTKKCF